MVSFLPSYLVALQLLLDVATDTVLLIVNLVKKDLSSSMILSKNLIEMLKHNLKAAVNSIRFFLRIIDDERSFFTRFTINNTVSVATSNNNCNATR